MRRLGTMGLVVVLSLYDSPLVRLLENALDGVDAVRRLEVAEIEDYTVSLISWRVLPAEGVPSLD